MGLTGSVAVDDVDRVGSRRRWPEYAVSTRGGLGLQSMAMFE